MKLIKNIDQLIEKVGYVDDENLEYYYPEDKELRRLLNYWAFFEKREEEIQKIVNMPKDMVIYSKLYWAKQFVKRHELVFGDDGDYNDLLYDMRYECDNLNWDVFMGIFNGEIELE